MDLTRYKDSGCRVAPHCLPDVDGKGDDVAGTGCPLERCIYEGPSAAYVLRDWLNGYDDKCRHAAQLRSTGLKILEIADTLKVNERTVYRLLRDAQTLTEEAKK